MATGLAWGSSVWFSSQGTSSRRNEKQFLYVADVMIYRPANQGELSWVEVYDNADLEWSFSTCHSTVRTEAPHGDR